MTKKHQNPQINNQNIDVFANLSVDQWRYITARIENPSFSKRATAEHIGISENTVYGWDKSVDIAYEAALLDIHSAAVEQRKQMLLKAIAVKISGLDSDDENVRQRVATEIIESELGKATQKTVSDNTDGNPIVIKVVYEDTLGSDD